MHSKILGLTLSSFLLAMVVAATAPGGAPATLLTCRGATSDALALRRYVQRVVSEADPRPTSAASARSLMGLASAMDTSQVSIVTNDSVCTRVTFAVDSALGRNPSTAALVVVQYGSRYAGYDTQIAWKGQSMMDLVDSTFTYVRSVSAF